LRGENIKDWLANVYGNKPRRWSEDLQGYARHRYMLNAFTRMRFCDKKDGALNFNLKRAPAFLLKHASKMPKKNKKVPWFLYAKRKTLPLRVVFGHWSSLGFYQDENVIALDTGCVWGGALTAVRLDGVSQKQPVLAISRSCKRKK